MATRIRSNCPNCDKSLKVDDGLIGKRVRCPACEHRFVLSSVAFDHTPEGAGSSSAEPILEAVETQAEANTSSAKGHTPELTIGTIGRFELKRVLGQGAFGKVYCAYDPALARQVALKVPKFDSQETRKIQRFLVEAKSAARLRHPNIVAVFESGQIDDQYFIASEYVDGETLSVQIKNDRPSFRKAAEWVRALAEALSYAHAEGIVHRDIKPENIMLDAKSRPQIMDFGLAKRLDDDSGITIDGSVFGTPAYMAPEQARGDLPNVGPHSDQYSLGVVLRELLTGQRPFSGPSHAVIAAVGSEEPPAPRTIVPEIPQDLEAICLKAMEKEPARRYADLAQMADDLNNWLSGTETLARPISRTERGVRWAKRNPMVSGLSAGLAIAIVAGFIGVTTQWIRANNNANRAQHAADEQSKARQDAQEAEKRAIDQREIARAAAAANRKTAYSAHMNIAQQAWEEADVGFMHRLLSKYLPQPGQEDLRSFEWYYWWRLSHAYLRRWDTHGDQIIDVAFSPDGKTLASASKDSTVKLWEVASGASLATLKGHAQEVLCVAFSPDGKTLASGSADATVILWNVQTGQQKRILRGHGAGITAVSFSPDGTRLASASRTVKLWDLATGESKTTATGLNARVSTPVGIFVDFSPDGQLLAIGGNSSVTLWNVADGQKQLTLQGHSAGVSSVAFSPDGKRLVSGSRDLTVKLWDLKTGKAIHTYRGHTGHIFTVAFSPDGNTMASAGRDLTVRLWDATTGGPIEIFRGHAGRVTTIAFSHDGKILASAGRDYTVALWDVKTDRPQTVLSEHTGKVLAVAFSPDSRMLASAGSDGTVKLWVAATGRKKTTLSHPGQTKSAAFSPDGTMLATGSTDNTVKLWDLATGKEKHSLKAPASTGMSFLIRCLAFSPDGRTLATNGEDKSVSLWNVATGELKTTLATDGQFATSAAFSPDGKLLAAGNVDKTVKVWDVATGRRTMTLQGHTEYVWTVGFSTDGKTLASAGMDTIVRLWDVATGKTRITLTGHSDTVTWLAFSPDGKTLATISGDSTVKLWDIVTGELKTTLTGHTDYSYCVAFSRDGKTLASGSLDKTVRIWRAAAESEVQTNSR